MLILTSRPLGGKVNHLHRATRSSQAIINPQYTKARLSLLINNSNASENNNNNNNNNTLSILKNLFYPRRSFHSSYTPYAAAPAAKKGDAEASGEAAAATEGEPKEKKKKPTKGGK